MLIIYKIAWDFLFFLQPHNLKAGTPGMISWPIRHYEENCNVKLTPSPYVYALYAHSHGRQPRHSFGRTCSSISRNHQRYHEFEWQRHQDIARTCVHTAQQCRDIVADNGTGTLTSCVYPALGFWMFGPIGVWSLTSLLYTDTEPAGHSSEMQVPVNRKPGEMWMQLWMSLE